MYIVFLLMSAQIIFAFRANHGLIFVLWIIVTLWKESYPVYNTSFNDPGFVICALSVCVPSRFYSSVCVLSCVWCKVDCQTLTVISLSFFLCLFAGLVDALRCVQWVLWLTCLSVLDCCALDSVGQETPSTERHERSHPSRGGHGQHLVPGHGCRLRVSFSVSVIGLSYWLITTFGLILFVFWLHQQRETHL